MVSPVRVRVPPLLFSKHFQGKRTALASRLHVESAASTTTATTTGTHLRCPKRKSLRRMAASRCMVGETWVYVSAVCFTEACPSISDTSFSCSLGGNRSWAATDAGGASSLSRTGSRSSSCAPGPSRGITSSSALRCCSVRRRPSARRRPARPRVAAPH
jgi:hypothetical protein